MVWLVNRAIIERVKSCRKEGIRRFKMRGFAFARRECASSCAGSCWRSRTLWRGLLVVRTRCQCRTRCSTKCKRGLLNHICNWKLWRVVVVMIVVVLIEALVLAESRRLSSNLLIGRQSGTTIFRPRVRVFEYLFRYRRYTGYLSSLSVWR